MMITWLMLVCRVGTGVGVGVGVGIGVGVGVGDELGVGVGDGFPGVGVGVGPGVIPVIPWQPARATTRATTKRQSQKDLFPMIIETNFAQGSPRLSRQLCRELLVAGLDVGSRGGVATRPQPG